MEHIIAHELIDEYVLGTLEQADYDAVEAHLETGCEVCLERVREAGEVSAYLAEGLLQQEPSDHVRQKLLRWISAEDSSTPANRPPTQIWGWTMATVGMAASILLVFWVNSLRIELSTLRSELGESKDQIAHLLQDNSVAQDAAYLFGLPCTKVVALEGIKPNEASFANVVLHPEEDFAVAYVYRMPQAPTGKEYQLWVELDGSPVSVGVFTVDRNGEALVKLQSLPEPLSIKSFQVTIEPQGGLQAPTGMRYLAGNNVLKAMGSH